MRVTDSCCILSIDRCCGNKREGTVGESEELCIGRGCDMGSHSSGERSCAQGHTIFRADVARPGCRSGLVRDPRAYPDGQRAEVAKQASRYMTRDMSEESSVTRGR